MARQRFLCGELLEERTPLAADLSKVFGPQLPPTDPTDAWQLVWDSADDLSQYDTAELQTNTWAIRVNSDEVEPNLPGTLTPIVGIDDAFVWDRPASVSAQEALSLLANDQEVLSYFPIIARQQSVRTLPNDPLINQEWHLKNTGQSGGNVGEDANVEPVWDSGITGKGVVIAIVDDGLQWSHPDLAPNYVAAYSHDFNENDSDPSPYTFDGHGTSVAGVAAGKGNNGIGVAGAAYNASIAGLRLIASSTSDAQDAAALQYAPQDIAIYSSSWGPYDDAQRLEGPGPLALAAIQNGVTTGRGGLGSIYVWAAGNGLANNDNVNYDGFASSRYAIAVSAIGNNGLQSAYSEPGAPILVAGYSSSSGPGIVTTDLVGSAGYDPSGDYTTNFGGTSAAAPLVSGVIALMLEANPNLSWRDVRHVLARSASKNSPGDSGWTINGGGHDVNHKYGFGAVDAAAAVSLAKTWNTVSPEVSYSSPVTNVNQTIPDSSSVGVTSTIDVPTNLRVEEVEVVFNAGHLSRGNLEVVLTSPSGTQSILAQTHSDTGDNYSNWIFSSTRHLDELSAGNWTLKVRDLSTGTTGTFQNWTLRLYGTPGDADFGDAPASYDAGTAANHGRMTALQLGASKDTEAAAQSGGDDGADEDGVVLPAVINGNGGVYTYSVAVSGGKGKLDGWIDFNRDGDFADPGEKIANSISVGPGANSLSFTAPGSLTDGTTYARFRLSTAGGLNATGAALDGEVEDYSLSISTAAAGTLDATLDGGTLTISDTVGSANNFSLSRTGSVLTITDTNEQFIAAPSGGTLSGGNHSLSFDLSTTTIDSLVLNAGGSADQISIDLSGGNAIPSAGIVLQGGGGADRLLIVGGNQGTATFDYANATDGSISLSAFGSINYAGLASITSSDSATNVVFDLPANASNDVTLQDDTAAANGMTRLAGSSLTTTDFSNPSGTLTIRRGSPADILRVGSLPDLTSNLNFGSSAAPFDQIELSGGVSLTGNKSLSAFGRTSVRLVSGAVLTVGGNVILSGDDISLVSNASVAGSAAVLLRPASAGRPINVGSTGAANELGLTDSELDHITARQIQIGDADSGPISVTGAVSLAAGSTSALAFGGPTVKFPYSSTDLVLNSYPLSFAAGTDLELAINGSTANTQYEQLNVTGTVRLGGVDLVLSGSYQPTSNNVFTLIANDGSDGVEGTFNGLPDGATLFVNGGSTRMRISYYGGDGNDVVLAPVVATVSGRVWNDTHINGVQEPGEPGVPQAVVELVVYSSGNVLGTTVTDADGNYSLTVSTGQFFVRVHPTPGFTFTAYRQGIDATLDSDVFSSSGVTPGLGLNQGDSVRIDAGLVGATPGFGWAATDEYPTYLNIGPNVALATGRDASGNVYSAGSKNYNGYIAKYTSAGARIWDAPLVPYGGGAVVVKDMSVSSDGTVLVVGTTYYGVDFDPGPGLAPLTIGNNNYGAFVAKFNTDGHLLWARLFNITGSLVDVDLDADADGNSYLSITFGGILDADPGTGVDNKVSGYSTAFDVIKLDYAGERKWVDHYANNSALSASDLQVSPAGEIVVAGAYRDTIDFDLGPGTATSFSSFSSPFVLKLNNDGQYVWSAAANGSSMPTAVALGADGSVVVTGQMSSATDFDPSPGFTTAFGNVFVWKLTAAGQFAWVNAFGETSPGGGTLVYSAAVDDAGSIYLGGAARQYPTDYDPGPLTKIRSRNEGYVLQLTPAGNFASVAFLTSQQTYSFDNIAVYAIAPTSVPGHMEIAGVFNNTVDLDPSAGVQFTTPPYSYSQLVVEDLNFPYNVSPTASLQSSLSSYVLEDGSVTINFTVDDLETPAGSLTVSGIGDPAILPAESFTFGGSGAYRWVTIRPAANRYGSSVFKLTVTDAQGGTGTVTGELYVNDVNDAPSFTKGSNLTYFANPGPLSISNWATNIVAGPYETYQSVAFQTVGNSNPDLFFAPPTISPDGTLSFTPADNAVGTATITIAAVDNWGTYNGGADTSATQQFTITINPSISPPAISDVGDQTILEDGSIGPLSFTIGDAETPVDDLILSVVTVGSSVPAGQVVFGGSGANRTVTITPLPDRSGLATITLRVTDADGGTSIDTIRLNVLPVNDVPSFVAGPDQSLPYNTSSFIIPNWATAISQGPPEEASQTLTFNIVGNTNPDLFSVQPAVSPAGALTYTKAPGMSGTAFISLSLSDDGGTENGGVDTSAVQSFQITFDSDSIPPAVTGTPGNQTIFEDGSTGALAFTVGDNITAAEALVITKTSSDATLIPASAIVIGGTEMNRTLTVTPAANRSGGPVTITVSVTDASLNVTTFSFEVTVLSVNDAPTFTKGSSQTVNEDVSAQTVTNWATGISLGGFETAQTGGFVITNNSNPSLFSVPPAISSTGTLTYTPAPNAFGTAAITVVLMDNGGTANGGQDTSVAQTFNITINPINDVPSFTMASTLTVNEDAGPLTFAGWASAISAGPNEASQTLTMTTTITGPVIFSVLPAVDLVTGNLTFTPTADLSGTVTVTVTLTDNGGTLNGGVNSVTKTFTLTVNAVNDAPSFTPGSNRVVNEDNGNSFSSWATGIKDGPQDESSQNSAFVITNNSNPSLFSTLPSIDQYGYLNYTPAANAFGVATITVVLKDDGGTANGGQDTSAPVTFTITINPVNDRPTFVAGASQTVFEDSGPQTVPGWATAMSAGPANEAGQTLTFNVTTADPSKFSVQPAIDPVTGTLTYTPAPNAAGNVSVFVTLVDNGGTANFGSDTSTQRSFTIFLTSVNDPPTFNPSGDVFTNEDATQFFVWAANPSDGDPESFQTLTFTILSNSNPALFSSQPTLETSAGYLGYTPAANAFGSATLTVQLSDSGGTANGGVNVGAPYTFTITINPVNDRPTFAAGLNQTVFEDAPPQTIAGWATAMSAGPANESDQTLAFNVAYTNPTLFSVPPAISPSGTLTYTLAPNQTGTSSLTITLVDNGGTANGGKDTSTAVTKTITVNGVNDPPTFNVGPNISLIQTALQQTILGWATAISPGASPNESGQSVTFNVIGNTNPGLFSVAPSVTSNGMLWFTPASAAVTGTATITLTASDLGGTANGGVDTSPPQSFVITILPANTAPSFVKGDDQVVLFNAGLQTVAGWATGLSAGPPYEAGQQLSFVITGNTNPGLFATPPAIAADGTLTYSSAIGASGSAIVTLKIKDNGGTVSGGFDESAEQSFVITVLPGVAPTDLTLSSSTIAENVPAGQAVGTFASVDSDNSEVFHYQLVPGDGDEDNSAFLVAGDQLLIADSPNFETQNVYHLRVRTTDSGGLSAEKAFTVSVSDLNDVPAAVLLSSSTVDENVAGDFAVGNLSALDDDANEAFSYQFVPGAGGEDNAAFEIVGNELRLLGSPDYETQSVYHVQISARDLGGLSVVATFAIAVQDLNEAPTAISLSNATLAENLPANSLVGMLSTSDVDANESFAYQFAAGDGDRDNAAFAILGNELHLIASPDFEAQAEYSLRVRATDYGGLAVEQVLRVFVSDANDAPSALQLSTLLVNENVAAGTAIGTLSTTDPDAAETFTYELVPGLNDADNAAFAISSDILVIVGSPDFEAQSDYHVRLRATDRGGLSVEREFVISVNDRNEAPAATTLSNGSVEENVAAGAVVGALTTTDPDSSDTFSYELVAGLGADDNATFSLSGNQLHLNVRPDAESQAAYRLRIRTTDAGGLFREDMFLVSIVDLNESPTGLVLSASSIEENVPTGAAVGSLAGIDVDTGESFTYEFASGAGDADNAAFVIAGNELQIIASPDAETQSQYHVRIRVTDHGGLFTEQAFPILIGDRNEAPLIAEQSFSVPENAIQGIVVGAVLASDVDAGDQLHFAIVAGNDGGAFVIDSSTGTIAVDQAAALDSVATPQFVLTIRVTDAAGLSSTAAATIVVLNVNEAPSFVLGADLNVDEDSGPSQIAGFVTSILAGPVNESSQSVTFVVASDNDSLFNTRPAIDADGTLTFSVAPNAFGVATVTVIAVDDGGNAYGGQDTSAAQTFTITVHAINDPPTFVKGPDPVVGEDAPAQSVSGWATSISTGAANELQSLAFEVTNDNTGLFSVQPAIDPATGTLTYTPAADRFGTAVVRVTLHDDGGDHNVSAEQAFTIRVTAVNDPPSFSVPASASTVAEDAALQTVPSFATALTPGPNESDPLSFQITGNSNPSLFEIAPSIAPDGTLTYKPAADAFGTAIIKLILTDGIATTAEQTFTIDVSAVNDLPSFTLSTTTLTVAEDAVSQSIPNFAANIANGPANEMETATFSIISNSNPSLFEIAPSIDADGALSYKPAANANGSATITVSLTDGTAATAEQTFTINVTAVDDPPSFNLRPDVTVGEDAELQTISGFASSISAGPNESQTLTFATTGNTNPELFAVSPTIDPLTGDLTFRPAEDANGAATITVELSDGSLVVSQTFTINVTPVNDLPSFTAGPNVALPEGAGQSIIAGWATGISGGPADESQELTFKIRTTNDALFSVLPAIDRATGTLSFTPALGAEGTAVVTISLTDGEGGTSAEQAFEIRVDNVTPHVHLAASQTAVVPDLPIAFAFSASDPSSSDQAAGFDYRIDWGDGTPVETPTNIVGVLAKSHAFAKTGVFRVTVTATDKDGAVSDPQSITITVGQTAVHKGALFVGGTAGNDKITVTAADALGQRVTVRMGTKVLGTYRPNKIVVYAGAGNDTVTTLAATIRGKLVTPNVPLSIFGGAGNDVINVSQSRGQAVILGNAGNDRITGSAGRDLLVGNTGADTIAGGGGDDLLIGGKLAYDLSLPSLDALMAVWGNMAAANTYENRFAALTNGTVTPSQPKLNLTTVQDDRLADNLTGGSGRDLFFAALGGIADQVTDQVKKPAKVKETVVKVTV